MIAVNEILGQIRLTKKSSMRKLATSDALCIHIGVQNTIVAYIRGLFSWLCGGWEVMERLGRHKASLAKPYLVMVACKSTLLDLPARLQSHRNPVARSQPVTRVRRAISHGDIL